MEFNFKIENLETRSCGKNLSNEGEHDRAEIVAWGKNIEGKDFCWTIAYWELDKEGYYLKFVGNRPFEKDSESFMKLAKLGQKVLDSLYQSNQ